MKREMKQLEDQAAASARSAQTEREHSLQLEKDLQILAAELETVRKESEAAKKTAHKAHTDLKAILDACHKGIRAMCHHIFGKLLHLPSFSLIQRTQQLISLDFSILQGLTPQNSSCPPANNSMPC